MPARFGRGYDRALRQRKRDFHDAQQALAKALKTVQVKNANNQKLYPYSAVQEVFAEYQDTLGTLYVSVVRYTGFDDRGTIEAEAKLFQERAVGGGDRCISTIVAILICAGVAIHEKAWLAVAKSIGDHGYRVGEELVDAKLPLEGVRPETFIEDENVHFEKWQTSFRPVILEINNVKRFHGTADKWPLPYQKEVEKGEGAHGKVFETVVFPRCCVTLDERNDNAPHVNPTKATYARKDLPRTESSHGIAGKEWEAHRLIQRHPKKFEREHIIYTNACLVFDDIVSMFMELADSNLNEFMQNPLRAPEPDPAADLRQISQIAAALDFLHTKLGEARCWHLDVKPENILVKFLPGQDSVINGKRCGGYMLKLADFSVSKFVDLKGNPISAYNLNKHFSHNGELDDETSPAQGSVTRRLGDHATCAPPEYGTEGERGIGPKSDVWGFGCVLSIFIVWMGSARRRDQSSGVIAFREFRASEHGDCDGRDGFVIFERSASSLAGGQPKLNQQVGIFFENLINDIPRQDASQSTVFRPLCTLLKEHVLRIETSARYCMGKVHGELRRIAEQELSAASGSGLILDSEVIQELNTEPEVESSRPALASVGQDGSRSGSRTSETASRSRSFGARSMKSVLMSSSQQSNIPAPKPFWTNFSLKNVRGDIRGTAASPSGEYFAFLYSKYARIFRVSDIIQGLAVGSKIPDGDIVTCKRDEEFLTLALTDNFLWIVPQSSNFKLLLCDLKDPKGRYTVEWKGSPVYVIKHIAPHPHEGKSVACVVKKLMGQGQWTLQVHILRLWLLPRLDPMGVVFDRPIPPDPCVVPRHISEDHGSSRNTPGIWDILPWHDPVSAHTASTSMSFFFSLDGLHLALGVEASTSNTVLPDGKRLVATVMWWTLETVGQPRVARLLELARNTPPCLQKFSISPISQHFALATIRGNFLSLLDLSGTGGFQPRENNTPPFGPVFNSADGSYAFMVYTLNDDVRLQRLCVDEQGQIKLVSGDGRLDACDLQIKSLALRTSCSLVRRLETSHEQLPEILLVNNTGKGAYLKYPILSDT